MKQLERIYVTEKQFRQKQSQKGAKFTHKINKIAIYIRHFSDYNQTLHARDMTH